jgi:hypothetical protein
VLLGFVALPFVARRLAGRRETASDVRT